MVNFSGVNFWGRDNILFGNLTIFWLATLVLPPYRQRTIGVFICMDYANNENFSIYCIKVMFRLWVCLSRKIIEVLAEFIVKIGMFAVSSV